jgi:TonB family protein
MRQRDITWNLALCLSLALHAAVIRWRAEAYVSANSLIRLAGFDRILVAQAPGPMSPQDVGLLGDDTGNGYATDPDPGDQPLKARQGEQDQSYLSRDPQSFGQMGTQVSRSLAPPGQNGANGSSSAQDTTESQSSDHPFGVQQKSEPAPSFKAPPDPQKGPAPKPNPDTPPSKATVAQSTASTVSMTAYRAPTGRPGPADSAASQAPQGQSDSDPFAVVGSAEFRPGSTKVQLGRKHRITRPRLSWDTVYDFQGMLSASVTLELQLDETGQVISAIVLQSSGSQSIDQPCRLAAYEWWFEPAKDATGKPVKDTIKFTIKFF